MPKRKVLKSSDIMRLEAISPTMNVRWIMPCNGTQNMVFISWKPVMRVLSRMDFRTMDSMGLIIIRKWWRQLPVTKWQWMHTSRLKILVFAVHGLTWWLVKVQEVWNGMHGAKVILLPIMWCCRLPACYPVRWITLLELLIFCFYRQRILPVAGNGSIRIKETAVWTRHWRNSLLTGWFCIPLCKWLPIWLNIMRDIRLSSSSAISIRIATNRKHWQENRVNL